LKNLLEGNINILIDEKKYGILFYDAIKKKYFFKTIESCKNNKNIKVGYVIAFFCFYPNDFNFSFLYNQYLTIKKSDETHHHFSTFRLSNYCIKGINSFNILFFCRSFMTFEVNTIPKIYSLSNQFFEYFQIYNKNDIYRSKKNYLFFKYLKKNLYQNFKGYIFTNLLNQNIQKKNWVFQ
jgi:hypothetical protein